MKKLSFAVICTLCACGSMMAQKSVVETVEKNINSYNSDFKAARANLKPALTNDETKDNAKTWFIAGKTEFGYYDQLLGKKQLKQKVNDAEMANALLDGFGYLNKALVLDTVPEVDKNGTPKLDKNGVAKVKTKYSKDIVTLLVGHFNDFSTVASTFYDSKNYKKAYEGWSVFTGMANNQKYGKMAPVLADTIVGQVQFFQGIAAWQDGDNKKAIESFNKAVKNGYTKKEVFDYTISNYAALSDNEGIIKTAKAAYDIYGSEDSQYISIMINDYINNNKIDEATELLDKAIANNPKNAEFYDVKGTLYENKKDTKSALECFLKAIELNPEYAKGQFDVGRYYYNEAVKKNDSMDKNLTASAIKRAFESDIKPLYKQALPYMEKAYKLDAENREVKHALRNIYYLLGMEAELNALESAN